MTPFQLPTGKTVFVEDPLMLTDEDIMNLIADDMGVEINNPFSNEISSIKFLEIPESED